MILAHCYLALRDLHADGGPVAGTWDRVVQRTSTGPPTSWSITPPGEVAIEVKLINAVSGRGLFALWGSVSQLAALSAANPTEIRPAREVWRLAKDGPGKARDVALHHRWWVCDIDGEIEVRRELIAIGESLVWQALPWVLPVGTITKIYHPTILWTLAGMGSDKILEDEPDRSP